MKRLFPILPILWLLIFLPSCVSCPPPGQMLSPKPIRGIWLTAPELSPEGLSEDGYRKKLDSMLSRILSQGLTDLFVQMRPDCDALYKSALFPESRYSLGTSYDLLRVLCDEAGKRSLKVHAWINPYRVTAGQTDISVLPEDSPALRLYREDKKNLLLTSSGIYLNPASESVRRLILDGVRELLEGYPIAGIHIDDYFYPPDVGDADEESYRLYTEGGGRLCLEDYRRSCVTALIGGICSTVKSFGEDKLFTVSPSADIEKDHTVLYADVEHWCENGGYFDFIIPQIYFGYENSSLPFEECFDRWLSLAGSDRLCVGLALYKQGKEDGYAGDGRDEWIEDPLLIQKQTAQCEASGCGYCLFSFSFLS